MEGAAGHPVPIHFQSIVFCRLAGCDEALDSFEVYKYGASLLYQIFGNRKRPETILRSTVVRTVRMISGRCVFHLSCFRFCKSIRIGVKNLQEIDTIAILQAAGGEKLQICNLTAYQERSDTIAPGNAVK